MKPNERRHFAIPEFGVELGIWYGEYKNVKLPWLRWRTDKGELVPTPEVSAEIETERANAEEQRAEQLAAKIQELGIDPASVTT